MRDILPFSAVLFCSVPGLEQLKKQLPLSLSLNLERANTPIE